MGQCPNCSAAVEEQATVCSNCGATLSNDQADEPAEGSEQGAEQSQDGRQSQGQPQQPQGGRQSQGQPQQPQGGRQPQGQPQQPQGGRQPQGQPQQPQGGQQQPQGQARQPRGGAKPQQGQPQQGQTGQPQQGRAGQPRQGPPGQPPGDAGSGGGGISRRKLLVGGGGLAVVGVGGFLVWDNFLDSPSPKTAVKQYYEAAAANDVDRVNSLLHSDSRVGPFTAGDLEGFPPESYTIDSTSVEKQSETEAIVAVTISWGESTSSSFRYYLETENEEWKIFGRLRSTDQ